MVNLINMLILVVKVFQHFYNYFEQIHIHIRFLKNYIDMLKILLIFRCKNIIFVYDYYLN